MISNGDCNSHNHEDLNEKWFSLELDFCIITTHFPFIQWPTKRERERANLPALNVNN